MKLTLLLLCMLFTLPDYAQISQDNLKRGDELIIISSQKTNPQDSSQINILRKAESKPHGNSVSELFIIGKNSYKRGSQNSTGNYPAFKGHWSGFYYGFVNFAKVPEAWSNLELDWGNSFAMQFNLYKYSINLVPRNNFGLVTGLGFEYQRLRFNNDNVSITKENGELVITQPMELYPGIENIRRSCFKNLYLTIPLLLEVQFPTRNTKRMYVSGGIMGGLRLHSKTKIVYEDSDGDKHKKKGKGNFNMVPFKADAIAKIGYRGINVWGSYTLTNMFKTNNAPSLHAYTIGIGATF